MTSLAAAALWRATAEPPGGTTSTSESSVSLKAARFLLALLTGERARGGEPARSGGASDALAAIARVGGIGWASGPFFLFLAASAFFDE